MTLSPEIKFHAYQALQKWEQAKLANPLKFFTPNGAQERAIKAIGSGEYYVTVLAYANGVGKTADVMAALGNMIYGAQTKAFDYPLFTHYPANWPKRFRIITESELVDDSGPIQTEINRWFPKGRYTWSKAGKTYNRFFESDTGWLGEVMTYEQDVKSFEGKTLAINIFVEPPPRLIFNACIARQRKGGLNILDMTPLYRAAWVKDELVDKPSIIVDGKAVGKSICLTADIEENCIDHGKNGQLEHNQIVQMVSRYDPDEREARAHGRFMHLTGLIFKNYADEYHVLEEFPEYYQKHYEAGKFTLYHIVDPHPRKAFAMGWYAVFPNNHVITLAEYPEWDFYVKHAWDWNYKQYADMIKSTELALGKKADVRLIDPNSGRTPSMGDPETPIKKFANLDLHFMEAPDSIDDRHRNIKELLGKPADLKNPVSPMIAHMSHCRNHRFSFSHYGWKENKDESKGISVKPELQHDDHVSLVGYGANHGFRYIEPSPEKLRLWKPRTENRGTYRGA